MRVDDELGAWLAELAEAGQRRALEQLVELYLPLVYNILGHGLSGSAASEDQVARLALQTTERVARGARPDRKRMRAWFAAAAVHRARRERLVLGAGGDVDFVDLAIVRLRLSGQAEDLALATRWLDDRDLLPLWWLEETGALTRADLELALDVTAEEAAERVERLRERVDEARAVIGALRAEPFCADLAALGVDGAEPADRRRLVEHVVACPTCADAVSLVPTTVLLAGLSPVPVAPVADHPAAPPARPRRRTSHRSAHGPRPLRTGARWAAAAMVPLAVVVGLVVATSHGPDAPAATAVAPTTPATRPSTVDSRSPAPPPSPEPWAAEPVAATTPRPSAPARTGPVYGSTVDGADAAPPYRQPPAELPARPTGAPVTVVGGSYQFVYPGVGNVWKVTRRGDSAVLRGTGYFAVTWGIFFDDRRVAQIPMPTWTGLRGKLFHVASGGGHRMDDLRPYGYGYGYSYTEPGATWMGKPSVGFDTLPPGAQAMWQVEFYYLDGEVALHNNEAAMDYDLAIAARTVEDIRADLTKAPYSAQDVLRYGVARDTGDDGAPVPQYLTRDQPADPTAVPQHSRVS